MSKKMSSLTAMAALLAGSGFYGTGKSNPPRTPDLPRDDEGNKQAARDKFKHKAEKRAANIAKSQQNGGTEP